jgi:hypothetical protein
VCLGNGAARAALQLDHGRSPSGQGAIRRQQDPEGTMERLKWARADGRAGRRPVRALTQSWKPVSATLRRGKKWSGNSIELRCQPTRRHRLKRDEEASGAFVAGPPLRACSSLPLTLGTLPK